MSTREEIADYFQERTDNYLMNYFMENIRKLKQPSLINLDSFYISQGLESLSEVKDPNLRDILEDFLTFRFSPEIH